MLAVRHNENANSSLPKRRCELTSINCGDKIDKVFAYVVVEEN